MLTDTSSSYRLSKALIADDHSLIRDGMRRLLQQMTPDVEVIEAVNCQEAIHVLAEHPDLDLVLFDLSMPDRDGLESLSELVDNRHSVPIVVISATEDTEVIRRVLAVGAAGYIAKSESNERIMQGIQIVLSGGVYVPLAQARALMRGEAGRKRTPLANLSDRQREVLRYIVRGFPNKEIATAVNLSEVTIKKHVGQILRELGAQNRTQAALIARKFGY